LTVYPIFFLVKYITKSRTSAFLSALTFSLSPLLVRMCFDLIKNSMGLFFLSLTILFCYLALEKRSTKYSLATSFFAILTGLTHILDFALAYGFLLLMLLLNIRNKSYLRYVLLPFAFSTILLALGFTVYWVMGGDPYKGISFIKELIYLEKISLPNIFTLNNILTPLLIGFVGVLLYKHLPSDAGRKTILTLSVILILLNIPIIPKDFLWRFNLMSSILIPIIIGALIGFIGNSKGKLLVSLIIIGFFIPQFITAISMAKPSISPSEYYEMKQLVLKGSPLYMFVYVFGHWFIFSPHGRSVGFHWSLRGRSPPTPRRRHINTQYLSSNKISITQQGETYKNIYNHINFATAPENSVFIVPNTKIRYWIETLTPNVVRSPKDANIGYVPILVLEVGKPVPPIAKPFFLGKYLKAYLLPMKR